MNSSFCLLIFFFFYVPIAGVNADKVGIEAAEMLLANLRHGGAVDEYLQDQVSTLPGGAFEPVRFEYLGAALNISFNC